jgi:hypothetical protein
MAPLVYSAMHLVEISLISCELCLIILSNRMNSATLRRSNTKEVRGYKSMLWIAGMAGAIYIKGIPVTKYKRQVTFFHFILCDYVSSAIGF